MALDIVIPLYDGQCPAMSGRLGRSSPGSESTMRILCARYVYLISKERECTEPFFLRVHIPIQLYIYVYSILFKCLNRYSRRTRGRKAVFVLKA